MSGESYEGWPNRETWALNLWLTNDEGTYYQALTAAAGDNLKDWVEDELWPTLHETESGRSMIGDVGSLWRVEWDHITESLRAV